MKIKIIKKRYEISDTDAFMIFRWLLILLTLLMIGYNAVGFKALSIAYILAIIYVVINLVLRIFVNHLITKQIGLFLLFLMDVSFVTLAVYLTEGFKSDFYLIYFLTILMTSLESSLKASIPSAIVATLLYYWIYSQRHPGGFSLDTSFLIKLPFFFLIAFFSGFWADRMKAKIKEAQAASREKIISLKEYYKNILNSISSCLVTVDNNMHITLYNPAFKMFSGITEGENIDNIEFLKPVGEILRDTIKGIPADKKELLLTIQEKPLYIGITTSPLRDANGEINGAVAIFKDLTMMKELEERAKRNERLVHMGKMASWIAHEIRNPLGVIKGLNKMVPQVSNPKKVQEYSKHIEKNIGIIDNIIEDVLNFAKQTPHGTEIIDVVEVMDSCIKDINRVHKGVEIKFESSGNNILIKAGKENIIRIFNNLILNAIEAMGENGKIDVSINKNHKNVFVLIQDYGPGIPEEVKDKIFEPFFTTKKKGTGLGLSIVQKLVDTEQGIIRWFSKTGEGTLFQLTFPKIEKEVK